MVTSEPATAVPDAWAAPSSGHPVTFSDQADGQAQQLELPPLKSKEDAAKARPDNPLDPLLWGPVTPGITLKVHGLCANVVQAAVIVAFECIAFLLVYRADARLAYLPLTVGLGSLCAGALGVAALHYLHSYLLALHVAFTLVIAAGSALLHAITTFMLQDRCALTQVSFQSCDFCACANHNMCTSALIRNDTSAKCVGSCKAWGRDVCGNAATYLPAMMVFACLSMFIIAAPTLFSLLLLIRLESAHGNLDHKVSFARNTLSHQLLLIQQSQPRDMDPDLLRELMRTLMAYGTDNDRTLTGQAAALLQLDTKQILSPPSRAMSRSKSHNGQGLILGRSQSRLGAGMSLGHQASSSSKDVGQSQELVVTPAAIVSTPDGQVYLMTEVDTEDEEEEGSQQGPVSPGANMSEGWAGWAADEGVGEQGGKKKKKPKKDKSEKKKKKGDKNKVRPVLEPAALPAS